MTLKVKKSSTLDILGSPIPRRKKKKKLSLYRRAYIYIFSFPYFMSKFYIIYILSHMLLAILAMVYTSLFKRSYFVDQISKAKLEYTAI